MRRPKGPAFTPPPDPRALALTALAKLEDAFVAKFATGTPTADEERIYAKYQKCKAHALGSGTTGPEAMTALRLAIIDAVKLAF
jgi:hypothetical protein